MKSSGYDSRQCNVPRARRWRLYTHQWNEQVGVSLPDVRQTRTVEPNNSNGLKSPLTVQSNTRILRAEAVDAPAVGVTQSRSSQA